MEQYVLRGNHRGKPVEFALRPGPQILGRDRHCDVWIPWDNSVSRRHAEIEVTERELILRDLGSLNGTFARGARVEGEVTLHPGDSIRLGHTELTLSRPEQTHFGGLAPEGSVVVRTTRGKPERDRSRPSRSADLLTALHEAGRMLSRSMSLSEVYDGMLDLLERFVRADRILILPPEEQEEQPKPLAARVSTTSANAPLRMSRTILRRILEEGESFLTTDAAGDPELDAPAGVIVVQPHVVPGAGLEGDEFLVRGHTHSAFVDTRNNVADAGCWLGERGSYITISEGEVTVESWP